MKLQRGRPALWMGWGGPVGGAEVGCAANGMGRNRRGPRRTVVVEGREGQSGAGWVRVGLYGMVRGRGCAGMMCTGPKFGAIHQILMEASSILTMSEAP